MKHCNLVPYKHKALGNLTRDLTRKWYINTNYCFFLSFLLISNYTLKLLAGPKLFERLKFKIQSLIISLNFNPIECPR